MAEGKEEWLRSAEVARKDGDFKVMRACAREILETEAGDVDALCLLAEATLLAGEIDEAKKLIVEVRMRSQQHLYGMLVEAEIGAAEFKYKEEISLLKGVIAVAAESDLPNADDIHIRALEMLADAYILFGEPEKAVRTIFELSVLAETPAKKAAYYSKGLFMTNYRPLPVKKSLELHQGYNAFFRAKMTFPHKISGQHGTKLRIGYISPDFRQHAAANFFTPLLKKYTRHDFVVYAYHVGKSDVVTKRFERLPVTWRNLAGLPPMEVARRIYADHIDILVDLSGHTQDSCLPVLIYRPAPVQVSGIGYINTTGLNEVDYFLSDTYCMPFAENHGFTERLMRPAHSHLCYSPAIVRQPPAPATVPAAEKNGYVTFGSFNNFNKITFDVLRLWRTIIELVPNSRLVIKSKICSVPAGREIVREKLREVGFDSSRVELRPYSPDYLEQYRDIDIALDTFPYNGGLTTCEALYMGVPVVSLRGNTHGSRMGTSILENADLPELVAPNENEYINRAVKIARNPEILAEFHEALRGFLQRSPLMNGEEYMKDLEEEYHRIWEEKNNPK